MLVQAAKHIVCCYNSLLSDKKLKLNGRGRIDHRCEETEGISVVEWYDSKPVYLISTFCSVNPMDQCKRWSIFEKRMDVERPHIVKEYNQHMGGVDPCYMMLELYCTDIRSNKWYMHIVYYCLDVAVLKAWLLYRRHLNQKPAKAHAPEDFRCSIAFALTLTGKTTTKTR